MGLDLKYRKVTVYQTKTKTSNPLELRRSVSDEGIGLFEHHPFSRALSSMQPYKAAAYDDANEVQENDTVDIAVLSEDEPLALSRCRAQTTLSLSASARLSSILNPLSRMTMRRTEQSSDSESNKTPTSTTSEPSTLDSTNTPPALMTPPPLMDLSNSFLEVDTDNSDEIMSSTFEDTACGIAKTPVEITLGLPSPKNETSSISSHVSDALLQHDHHQRKSLLPLEFVDSHEEEKTESEMEKESSAITNDCSGNPTTSSVDTEGIRQARGQATANFDTSLHDSSRVKPGFRTTEVLKRVTRHIRGLSSPPRMLNQDARPNNASMAYELENTATFIVYPQNNEVPSVSMYHGQEFHLAFETTTGQSIQVQGRPKQRGGHNNPFSRRVYCHAVQPYDASEDGHTLRLIGHTTDGLLCGGDCVSFARSDGTMLRVQKMSKKLAFSSKSDVRAKFIIAGVPDRTPVSSHSRFYLQSVYDRNKVVGFLPSRREKYPGCLAMYDPRNAEDKIEPIQFFMRHGGAF